MTEPLLVNRVDAFAPFAWLADGFRDLYRLGGPAIGIGVIFGAIGGLLTIGLYLEGAGAWLPVLSAGFLLIAPVAAAPFSVASRALEDDQVTGLLDMIFIKTASPTKLFMLLLCLALLFWIWGSAASQLAWLVGREAHSGLSIFLDYIGGTYSGRAVAVVGVLYGGGLAVIAYLISAITVPMLVDRKIKLRSAIGLNILGIVKNPVPMTIWVGIVAVLTIAGMAAAFLWFIIIFPLLGFASWHAYRDLFGVKGSAPVALANP